MGRPCTYFAQAAVVFCWMRPVAPPLYAQDPSPSVIEVYWKHTRTVALPGVSHVEVYADSVCQAQVAEDQVRIVGLVRGETLVFVWVKDQRWTWLVRVVDQPEGSRPRLQEAGANEAPSRGVIGSSVQSAAGSGAPAGLVLFHRLQWDQEVDGNHLIVQGQGQDTTATGAPAFNLTTASVQYRTPNSTLSVLDSIIHFQGGLRAQIVPASTPTSLLLRGADFDVKRDAGEFEAFAGVTLPPYFLNLSGTRGLLGFNFSRSYNSGFCLYSTTALASVAFPGPFGGRQRQATPFQTLGFTARVNQQWAFQLTGGASTRGLMGQGAVSYQGWHRSFSASFTRAALGFPLNQLQLLPAGRSSGSASGSLQLTAKTAAAVMFQYSSTQSSALFAQGGSSAYLNPNFNFVISPRNHLTLNYTFTHTQGGLKLGQQSDGQRADLALSSQFNSRLGNSSQITFGTLSDPLQFNSQAQLAVRDAVNLRVRSHTLFVSLSYDRTNPSLVNRLNQEISLLAPAFQQLFLLDPVGFVQSSILAPEIRTLLNNLQPSNMQISAGGQFQLFHRVNFSPMLGYFHSDQGLTGKSDSHLAGYSLSWQMTPTLQLQSSLSNVFLLDSTLHGLRRNTVLAIGFNKSLSGPPRWLLPSRGHRGVIRGRVFRDLNVNGVYNAGEPGWAGLRVNLSTGEASLTDAQGRFEFAGLLPGVYEVTLPFGQFPERVRATTRTSVRVDLSDKRSAEVNFGIVNFSRILGNVYNDYLANDSRQPDAPSLRDIRLRLVTGDTTREVLTDSGGDYEFDGLVPAGYQLSIDVSTIPADFIAPVSSYTLHIEPASTVVQDMPLRALRTISGKILFGQTPLAGVRVAAAQTIATSDSGGNFLLRNLPAGRLTVRVLADGALPDGVRLPSGEIELPREPAHIENATIVISNAELLKYLQQPTVEEAAAAGTRTR